MKKSISKLAIVAIAMAGLQSCATLISGNQQKLTFETNVQDAKVYSNFDYIGQANEELKIPRHGLDKMYMISAEGCRDTSFVLETKFNGLVWLDVVNPLGMMLDFSSGAQFKTPEKVINVELDCDSTAVMK